MEVYLTTRAGTACPSVEHAERTVTPPWLDSKISSSLGGVVSFGLEVLALLVPGFAGRG